MPKNLTLYDYDLYVPLIPIYSIYVSVPETTEALKGHSKEILSLSHNYDLISHNYDLA